ncbi:MAG: PQQ-dependent sugar dehydrogenase [Verrucomicrobia bacterium]|nr:PQQ-dependent sugar dehydrogenase [Verrucomicrobiota bacterium]
MKILVASIAMISGLWAAAGQPRLAWTTSRVDGSPDPPRAFVHQEISPQLRFSEAVELISVPSRGRFLLLERRGKILSFSTIGAVKTADEVVDLLTLHPDLLNAFGVILHPKFRENRQIFVCYSRPSDAENGVRVSRFTP